MDVAVSVITLWTGRARFMTTVIALPTLGITTTYISRINEYTCVQLLSSQSSYLLLTDSDPLSGTVRVTVGMANNYFLVS